MSVATALAQTVNVSVAFHNNSKKSQVRTVSEIIDLAKLVIPTELYRSIIPGLEKQLEKKGLAGLFGSQESRFHVNRHLVIIKRLS